MQSTPGTKACVAKEGLLYAVAATVRKAILFIVNSLGQHKVLWSVVRTATAGLAQFVRMCGKLSQNGKLLPDSKCKRFAVGSGPAGS
jgi:hypothetical protein